MALKKKLLENQLRKQKAALKETNTKPTSAVSASNIKKHLPTDKMSPEEKLKYLQSKAPEEKIKQVQAQAQKQLEIERRRRQREEEERARRLKI